MKGRIIDTEGTNWYRPFVGCVFDMQPIISKTPKPRAILKLVDTEYNREVLRGVPGVENENLVGRLGNYGLGVLAKHFEPIHASTNREAAHLLRKEDW